MSGPSPLQEQGGPPDYQGQGGDCRDDKKRRLHEGHAGELTSRQPDEDLESMFSSLRIDNILSQGTSGDCCKNRKRKSCQETAGEREASCHHHLSHLQRMESVKQVAAHHFVRDSGRHSYAEMYGAVLSVAGDARSLYADEAVAGMDASEFAAMMFRDGCFLLQYIIMCTDRPLSQALLFAFESNQACISNDIMLLENQIRIVEEFVAKMGRTLQARADMERKPFVLDGSYTPPHLLGLLRFYKTGGAIRGEGTPAMSKTISAIELQEIGIKLTASKTTKFVDMGIKKGLFSAKFFLAPLLLDEIRSCWLVNMAAFELCMLKDTEICSYIAVLAMLMDREEDVHELRSKRLVQGELTNKEMLDFFKMLVKHISGGPLYIHILEEIESYKLKRRVWIMVHEFVYKNLKTIVTLFSIVGVLVGIFKTLLSLKQH